MDTAGMNGVSSIGIGRQEGTPVVGLASALVVAVAGGLLGYSLLSRKRDFVGGQVCLGLLTGVAGVMTWRKRQEELAAARQLMDRVHDVRDKRWLKKNPVAYG